VDVAGNLYLADAFNNRVRYVTPTVGTKNVLLVSGTSSIYPNPAVAGKFTVDFSTASAAKVKMYITDIAGKVVYQNLIEANKAFEVNLSEPAGVYFVNASAGNEMWNQKVTIIE
jgi:hypothetical protein